jgi:hypothetical protein
MIVTERIDARRLVFVDEMSANTSLATVYAWARRGKRTRTKAPRNRADLAVNYPAYSRITNGRTSRPTCKGQTGGISG